MKNMAKQCLAIFLAVAIVLSLPFSALAAETLTMNVGSAAGLPGSTVTITIDTAYSKSDVSVMQIDVTYDKNVLTPTSYTNGPVATTMAAAGFFATNLAQGGINSGTIRFGGYYNTSGAISGTVQTLTFTINSGVSAGTSTAISAVFSDIRDETDTAITTTPAITNGTVTVQSDNTVTYNSTGADSGTVPTDSNTYLTGTNLTVKGNTGNLVKANYTFSGWRDNTSGTGTLYAAGSVYTSGASNINFYPQWTINQYTATFNSNGGSAVTAITQDYNTSVAKPADPTKTGYTFAGWYSDSGQTSTVSWPHTLAANATFYAKWTINQYAVTFDSKGGSAVTAITQDYDTSVAKPTDPTQTGYTFAGWYSDSGLTSAVSWPHKLTANATFYAKWTINQYTATFNSNGGSAVTAITQDYNTSVAKPTDPTKAGHTFAGWYSDSGLTSAVTWPYTPLTANATFYAKWTVNSYVITYDAQSGTVTPTTQTKLYGSTYGKGSDGTTAESMPTPVRAGYTFGGWYTATFGSGTLITDSTSVEVTSATALYAKWTGSPYVITYDAQGGTVTPATQTKLYGATYGKGSDGTTTEIMPTPTKTGYTFGGWYTAANGSGTLITDTTGVEITADTTLYAKWTASSYVITYDVQGGTVTPTTQTKLYGSTYGKDKDGADQFMPLPTRTGYDFTGWFTAATGGTLVTDATPVTTASAHTLYAQWNVKTYTLSFDGNTSTGGTVPASLPIQYQASGVVSDNTGSLVKTGYTFNGWNTAADGSGTSYWPGMSYTIGDANVTLYAKWTTTTTYTVTYDVNGGTSGTAPAYVNNYKNGETVTVLGNMGSLAKSGYTFAGWNTQADGKGTDYAAGATFTMGTGNVVLYAKWTVNSSGGIIETKPGASDTQRIIDSIKGYSSNIEIDMSGSSTIVKSEVFSTLKEYPNKTLTIEGTNYKWIVNGKDIINPTAYSSYDLGVKLLWENKKEITKIPAGIPESKLVMQLSINHSGELPGQMYLEFSSIFYGVSNYSGKTLHFYSRNDATGKYEYISNVTVGSDGKIRLPFTHASTYLLTETMILTDIENHWAYSSIMKMIEAGVVNGNGSGLFEPDKSVTRAEFAKMIATAFGYKATSTVTQFSDVKSTDWYSDYVSAVYENGIMNGAGSTTFAPNDVLSREQMAAVIYRVLQNKKYSLSTAASKTAFSDESRIETYAIEAVNTLTDSGLMTGTGNNMFAPKSYATKAQVAAIVGRVTSTNK